MSGHNKWSQIKRKKEATDAKKSKIFSKLVRLISMEAKLARGDENAPGLLSAIAKAKRANMPNDNIERAIKKAAEAGGEMEPVIYEAYGPGGAGLIIETLTDNRNRTAQEVKHTLSKNGSTLGKVGSVTWSFIQERTEEGLVWKPQHWAALSEEALAALEKLVDELEENDDVQEVYTNAE